MNISPENLKSDLKTLYETENRIEAIVKDSGLRFSTNKLTADLGEFYAFQMLSSQTERFDSVEQEATSNAEFDFTGKLASNSDLFQYFGKKEIRIEVKTRRNQEGVKYLSSLKPEKFDLLCVVDMAKDYTLKKIYFVTTETANKYLDRKRQRLIFKENMEFIPKKD